MPFISKQFCTWEQTVISFIVPLRPRSIATRWQLFVNYNNSSSIDRLAFLQIPSTGKSNFTILFREKDIMRLIHNSRFIPFPSYQGASHSHLQFHQFKVSPHVSLEGLVLFDLNWSNLISHYPKHICSSQWATCREDTAFHVGFFK